MNRKLTLLLSVFLFFALLGAKGAEDQGGGQEVLKELDDFQKSLANWMKNLDTLGSQFNSMQKNVNDSLIPLKEFDKSAKGIEEKLNTIISRVEIMEKSSSVAEVKGMLDSFGKTFDVLKKLLSDITKRVEDQEVKTAVFEKKLMETQKPLEPVKKTIEDLSKAVTDKIGDQEKRITAVEDSIRTRVTTLDSALKSFDEQLKSLSGMDSRIKRLEKTGPVVTGTVTVETQPTAQAQIPVGTETAKATEGAETVVVVKEPVATPEEGFKDIGDGFYIRNVNLFLFGSSSQIKGEVKNFSDRDRSIATFVIRVYNASNMLLFTQDFSIKTFKKGEIRAFNEIISGYRPIDIARYEIEPKRRY
ncbi:MAG: hypothetical protein A2Y11_03045 [Planctomycetes bacterium GWC2_39_26]|nr:MAG: hypothetical protein A2Y11_03045 [Planctomycetes bacterium GWC2_39_26]